MITLDRPGSLAVAGADVLQAEHTSRPIIYRQLFKVVVDSELVDGTPIHEVYVTCRGRGFALTWGSARTVLHG